MKKNFFGVIAILFLLTSCGSEKQSVNIDVQSSVIEPSEIEDLADESISDLWQQKEIKDDESIFEFVTGLQIIFPKEWEDKIVLHTEAAVQTYGGGLVVCEKRNAEANAGGVLFVLEYFKYDKDAIAPYEIFCNDKVVGVYQKGEDIYALVFTLPRDMNYVEGNEEMQKAYECVDAFTDEVQIVTSHMEGFTECGLDALDWIIVSGSEQPENLEMMNYHNTSIELEYPATWEVKEETGEDGSEVRFYDEAGENVFGVKQGEAWRVDLDMMEEDYKKLLSELYQEVEIIELSKTEVNGYAAQKLMFSYIADGEKRTITRYIVVAGYAFFELNYIDSMDMMSEDNVGEAVIQSIIFVND